MVVKRFLITRKILFFTILIGIVAGFSAVLFYILLDIFDWFFLETLVDFSAPQAHGERSFIELEIELFALGISGLLLIIPAIGGFFSGLTVYNIAPEAEGHGTDAVIKAVHEFGGGIRGRVAFTKLFASAATIGSGGSAGREGPIAQITASIVSFLAEKLKFSEREREILVMAAAAAGVGSIFKSPVGGALFGVEVPYKKDYEVEVFIPALIASFIGYAIFCSVVGWQPIFKAPFYTFSPIELPLFALLGLVAGLFARIYVRTFYIVRDGFKGLRIPDYYKPAIGGLIVGLMAIFFPQVLSTGYGWVQLAIYGELAVEIMFILIFAKILATAFTIGSGGSGGVFAPSIVIGAMIGGVFGHLVALLMPGIICDPGVFVIIGMSCFFAGAAKVPLTSIIMVAEMTGDYNILAPAILASTISYLISGDASIYENQLEYREESPIHLPELISSVLEKIKVEDVMTPDFQVIPEDMLVIQAKQFIAKINQVAVPVINGKGEYIGLLSVYDLMNIPTEKMDKLRVRDVIKRDRTYVLPKDPIKKAISLMIKKRIFRLPVINYGEKREIIGCIAYEDIIKALYYKAV